MVAILELQCFNDIVANSNPSIKYTYTTLDNTVTFLELQLTIDDKHIESCVHLNLVIHTIIFYCHPVILLHANIPFNFHKCYESNVIVLTMMILLRFQIKSGITFLQTNYKSISLNQPMKMFTQFTVRLFLGHLQRRFFTIALL